MIKPINIISKTSIILLMLCFSLIGLTAPTQTTTDNSTIITNNNITSTNDNHDNNKTNTSDNNHTIITNIMPTPSQAYAAKYDDMDTSNIANDTDGLKTSQIQFTTLITDVTTTVILPIAIIVVAGKVIYIALFPLILGIDPLDMLDKDTFREGEQEQLRFWGRGGESGSTQRGYTRHKQDWGHQGNWKVEQSDEAIKQILKDEMIGTAKGLVVVISVWSLINLIIWFISLFLGYIK